MRLINFLRIGVPVNNLKLVYSDAYLDCVKDVVVIIRNPRFVRRLLRMQEAYYRTVSNDLGFSSPILIEAQFRDDLSVYILEALYSDEEIFSKSQARKIKAIPHPVLSDFKFY